MILLELITNIQKANEDSIIYVQRIDGQFTCQSETQVLDLTEEELEWKTTKVSEIKCPGYEYFLEVFLAKEIIDDINPRENVLSKCKRLIYYAEFDA